MTQHPPVCGHQQYECQCSLLAGRNQTIQIQQNVLFVLKREDITFIIHPGSYYIVIIASRIQRRMRRAEIFRTILTDILIHTKKDAHFYIFILLAAVQ